MLGLLSKTVTATLPAALLVIFWWQRGRLSWRRDVLPLVPFFVLGRGGGMFTAWVERKLIGAEGAAFDLTLVERCLIAGRVIWFYLGKLLWPAQLLFIYPRWQISQAVWWQYVFPLAPVGVVGRVVGSAAAVARARWRGCCSSAARSSPCWVSSTCIRSSIRFVADHFQYLASLGIITLAAAGLALLLARWGLWGRPGGYAAVPGAVGHLGQLDLAAEPDVRRH